MLYFFINFDLGAKVGRIRGIYTPNAGDIVIRLSGSRGVAVLIGFYNRFYSFYKDSTQARGDDNGMVILIFSGRKN